MLANTPDPPYFAVIFTSIASKMQEGYHDTVVRMHKLAEQYPGFIGMESAGESFEITVSYWRDEESILLWKQDSFHQAAQEMGKTKWYNAYHVRVAKVERAYSFTSRQA